MPTAFKASPSGFEMGSNKINSSDRFIRKVANPANRVFYMCQGPSIGLATQLDAGGSLTIAWRFTVGAADVIGKDPNFTAALPSGFNTPIDGAL